MTEELTKTDIFRNLPFKDRDRERDARNREKKSTMTEEGAKVRILTFLWNILDKMNPRVDKNV